MKETVTVERDVPMHIQDLVYFGQLVANKFRTQSGTLGYNELPQEEQIRIARDFYESRHGED